MKHLLITFFFFRISLIPGKELNVIFSAHTQHISLRTRNLYFIRGMNC